MRKLRPLLIVLGVQILVLVMIPMKKIIARAAGQEITLTTRPVDPYSILSGYYVTLAYEAEVPSLDLVEPGIDPGEDVFVTVADDLPAWRVVSVSRDRPHPNPEQVSIPAIWRGSSAEFSGVDRFYISEDDRHEVDRLMREAGGRALVDLKIDSSGSLALLRLRIDEHTFGLGREQ